MTDRPIGPMLSLLEGLSQTAAARLLGVDPRTSRKWANAERDVPEPAARFLRYLIATRKTGAHAMGVLGLDKPASPTRVP